MKRPLFIIIGAVLVLVLVAVWIYVLFFGTPGTGTDEAFTDLDFNDTTDVNYLPGEGNATVDSEPIVDINGLERLKQLTTKPVAGYGEVASGTIPTDILYVEAGTGHIFSIDLETGEDERVSATTIPSSQEASFAGNGRFVMMQSGYGNGANFTVGQLSTTTDQLKTSVIFEKIVSFAGTPSGVFLYAVQTNNSLIAKSYNPITLNTQTLFIVPFRDATVQWGTDVSDTHYIYPKTTSQLESFLYAATNGTLSRLPVNGYGMSAIGNDDYVLFSKQTPDSYQTYTLSTDDNTISNTPLIQIPEKCVFSTIVTSRALCANSVADYNSLMPDPWYKGEISFADNLFELTVSEGRSTLVANTFTRTQQNIDAIELQLGAQDANIYFTNRNDQTLWMFVRVPLTELNETN